MRLQGLSFLYASAASFLFMHIMCVCMIQGTGITQTDAPGCAALRQLLGRNLSLSQLTTVVSLLFLVRVLMSSLPEVHMYKHRQTDTDTDRQTHAHAHTYSLSLALSQTLARLTHVSMYLFIYPSIRPSIYVYMCTATGVW